MMREGQPGAIPGMDTVNVTMGEPHVINLSGSELSGDLNEQIQQAMRMAQQAAEQPGQFAQPVEAAQPDRIAQLERLAALRGSGALTDEEFEAEKAKLLGG